MTDRHADHVTMDHIIELRKEIGRLEKQLDNALDVVMAQRKQLDALRHANDHRLLVLQEGEGPPVVKGFLQHGI